MVIDYYFGNKLWYARSFKASGSTCSYVHHRLPTPFNAEATRGARNVLQTQCILNNHGIYLYKTNTKRMTDHYCILFTNILEIHKQVLLQFRLLSDVVMNTPLKMVRKRIENVAEIWGYIKARCKLGLSVKSIHDEMCVVYGDNRISFSTVYRLFKKFSSAQESVKDAPYSGRSRSSIIKSNINKIKSINEKDARGIVRQLVQMTNLGLASVHFILKTIIKVTKISAR